MDIKNADEIIEGGRDVTIRPGGNARFAYNATVRSQTRAGIDLRTAAVEHAERLQEWPSFTREVFARLYDEDGCTALPPEQGSAWGTTASGHLEGIAGWSDLRASCQVARTVAAEAAAMLAGEVARAMGVDRIPEGHKGRRDPEEIGRDLRAVQALMEGAGASEGEMDAATQGLREEAAAAGALRQAMHGAAERARPGLRVAVARAATAAKQHAEAVEAMVAMGFSREGPGSAEAIDPGLLRDVRLDPRMASILKWAGRFREAARGVEAKAEGRCDVVGIMPTGDAQRLTPLSRAMLGAGGGVGFATLVDLAEGRAQGWQQRGTAPKVSGDVVLLLDRSGSMSGEREQRARGLFIAALTAALAQGRRVVASSFAGEGDVRLACVVPGDLKATAEAIRALCVKAGGGTDVDGAIDAAVAAGARFPGGLRSPDVLLGTDGEFDPIAPAVLGRLGERRLFGVLIEVDDGERARHPELDAAWCITGAIDPSQAAEVLRAMRAPRKAQRGAA